MRTKELTELERVLAALKEAGIEVAIGHMYNGTGYDLFIAFPVSVTRNGHGFELTPGVNEEKNDRPRLIESARDEE